MHDIIGQISVSADISKKTKTDIGIGKSKNFADIYTQYFGQAHQHISIVTFNHIY